MRELFRAEGIKTEPQYTIDAKGTLIFKLPDGGFIRDTGTEVHFSTNNDLAQRLAVKLAQYKWGNNTQIEGRIVKLKSLLSATPQRSHGNGLNR